MNAAEYEFGELLMTTCELLERTDGSTFSEKETDGKVSISWLLNKFRIIPEGTYITFIAVTPDDANNIHAVVSPMGRNIIVNRANVMRVDDVVDKLKAEDHG